VDPAALVTEHHLPPLKRWGQQRRWLRRPWLPWRGERPRPRGQRLLDRASV